LVLVVLVEEVIQLVDIQHLPMEVILFFIQQLLLVVALLVVKTQFLQLVALVAVVVEELINLHSK
jgi:hypothetical protein